METVSLYSTSFIHAVLRTLQSFALGQAREERG